MTLHSVSSSITAVHTFKWRLCFWRKPMFWQKDEAPTVYASEINYTLQSIQPLGLPSGITLLAKSYFPLTEKDKIKGLQY